MLLPSTLEVSTISARSTSVFCSTRGFDSALFIFFDFLAVTLIGILPIFRCFLLLEAGVLVLWELWFFSVYWRMRCFPSLLRFLMLLVLKHVPESAFDTNVSRESPWSCMRIFSGGMDISNATCETDRDSPVKDLTVAVPSSNDGSLFSIPFVMIVPTTSIAPSAYLWELEALSLIGTAIGLTIKRTNMIEPSAIRWNSWSLVILLDLCPGRPVRTSSNVNSAVGCPTDIPSASSVPRL